MKKILLILCAILTTTSANATQMCARRDTTVIPLDGDVVFNTKRFSAYPLEWMWAVFFDYGTTYGFGTCLSLQDIRDIEGNQELTTYVSPLSTDDEEFRGRTGYYNGDTTNPDYERKHCYSKMAHPMSSQWIYYSTYNSADMCAGTCISGYGAVLAATGQRDQTYSMYRSVGQSSGYIEIDENEYTESVDLTSYN